MRTHQTDFLGWDEALSMFGGDDALMNSAFRHKALMRKREVGRAGDLLRLALIYGPGGHSLRMAEKSIGDTALFGYILPSHALHFAVAQLHTKHLPTSSTWDVARDDTCPELAGLV